MNAASFEGTADRYINLLNRLIDGEDWPRALQASRDWLSEDPENIFAHRIAAQALINLERYPEALPHIQKVLTASPNNGFVHRLAAIVYFHQKTPRKADEHIQRAIELQPNDALHWYQLAWMRHDQGQLDDAARHASRALELQPNNPHILNLLALCNRKGDPSQFTQYRRALEIDPENSVVHNNLGVYYLNVDRDYEAAENCFRQALRLSPTDKTAQKNLLLVLRHRDRFYRALRSPLSLIEKVSWGREGQSFLTKFILIGLWIRFGKVFWGILILWFVLIFPLQKAYEYLTLGDIQAEAGMIGARRGGLFGYRRWPFATRFSVLVVATMLFWGGVYFVFRHTEINDPLVLKSFGALISLVALCFLIVYISRGWRRARMRWITRRSEKRFAKRMGELER